MHGLEELKMRAGTIRLEQFCKVNNLAHSNGFAHQLRPSRIALKRKVDNPLLNIFAVWFGEEMN